MKIDGNKTYITLAALAAWLILNAWVVIPEDVYSTVLGLLSVAVAASMRHGVEKAGV